MATTIPPGEAVRRVTCPQCGGDSIYSVQNPYRPFCSERCKQMDLGAEAPPDDAQHGDPRHQH